MARDARIRKLEVLHRELDGCTACPKMIGPVVHGPPVATKIFLLGQAPGPREGNFGRPFAWTAGKTLFRWFHETLGVEEELFRKRVYMAAVARCFPGKAKGGGDRRPDRDEIEACRPFLAREVEILQPALVLAIGQVAIFEVLGKGVMKMKMDELVGQVVKTTWHGVAVDVVPFPHPSGASPWHKMEPGKTLLGQALRLVKRHPVTRETFGLGQRQLPSLRSSAFA